MTLEKFKTLNQKEIDKYGKTIPVGYTEDKDGNILTYKDLDGFDFWWQKEYNKKGKEIWFINSRGTWVEHIYDKNGNVLVYETEEGIKEEFIYDKNGNEIAFKNNDGEYVIKSDDINHITGHELVTKEEYDKFIKEKENE